MGLVRPPFSVTDPGEGPPHFSTKLRPEGSKKFFLRPPPPLSQGLDDRPPPSPPLSEGLDPQLILEFATKGRLALIPFKIGRVSSFLGCVP